MQQMTCPKCQGQMRQYERNSVTVDQCAECRGIFLDRGELEKLIDAENAWHSGQAAPVPPAQPPYAQPAPQPGYGYQQTHYRDHDSGAYPQYGHGHGHKKKKKHSFLEELFD